MFDKEFDIAELIALSQKQELTERDELVLREWLKADQANPILLASLSNENSIRDKMKTFEAPDSEVLWETVIRKLSDQPEERNRPVVSRLWPRIGIAAAAAIIIVVGAGVFYFNQKPTALPQDQLVANDIAPGTQGATLTLANGKKIKLTNAANGELAEEAGVIITKSANGQLIYSVSNLSPSGRVGEAREGSKSNQPSLSEGTSLPEGERNVMNTLSTDNGETYQLRLPDGSLVALNATSSLEYPANFNGKKERRVKLTGEGYFEVAKDKAHPFIVKTAEQEVEVLGTHFNVNAYADEKAIATTLLEGSVKVNSGEKNNKILKPGEQALNKGNSIQVKEVDTENITDWKDGDFNLDQVDFRIAMRKIARWYNVEVIYDDKVPTDIQTGGWISRSKKLSTVLKFIESSGLVHFKIEGRKVYVYK